MQYGIYIRSLNRDYDKTVKDIELEQRISFTEWLARKLYNEQMNKSEELPLKVIEKNSTEFWQYAKAVQDLAKEMGFLPPIFDSEVKIIRKGVANRSPIKFVLGEIIRNCPDFVKVSTDKD